MVNMGYIYIKDDLKIAVGLHEAYKPVTLIHPRPRILIEKIVDDEVIRMSEYEDDSMNIILQKFSFDEIFEAMYDKEKLLYYKIN
jgi:hypothetical protein